jgi:hypothetical protein
MEDYREDYWKLAEVEDRFNNLQGGLRALASTWTLAAFAGLAVLFQVAEKVAWLVPPSVLAWLVCVLAVFGLGLLWLMDQFVYQRLLAAPFFSALVLEEAHADLPPVRALMLAGSSGGMSRYLRLFYFLPIALFCLLSIGVVVGGFQNGGTVSTSLQIGLIAGSLIIIVAALGLYKLSSSVGTRALAKGLGFDSAHRAVDPSRLAHTVQAALAHAETSHSTVVPK